MKIGLLAYHSAINFGATLQLLSTFMYLKNHGHDPVIINWIADGLEDFYNASTPVKQKLEHQQMRKTLWKETSLCHTDRDISKVIKQEEIEAVIIGSDAVCQHHTIWERLVFPCRKIIAVNPVTSDRIFPNAFWATWNQLLPHPIPVAILSASSQDSEYRYFSKKTCREMLQQITKYSYVSVRDAWTRDMFQYVTSGKIDPPVTPDPVFAFNNNASSLLPGKKELAKRFSLPDKYILISFLNKRVVSQQWLNEFQELAKSDGISCVKLPFSNDEGFGELDHIIHLPLSPIEWYALIKYSQGYVGNNMHPIVVSLHNAVPFFSFDNYGIKRFNGLLSSDKSSKIKHLVQLAGLSEYRISCFSRTFQVPAASDVYKKLNTFPIEISRMFSNNYYKLYEAMMLQMIHSLNG
ncbi:MAG: polysaccharide pyruvyl transferase family protein [Prevotella sp.]